MRESRRQMRELRNLPAIDDTTLILDISGMTQPILQPFELIKVKTLEYDWCMISIDIPSLR